MFFNIHTHTHTQTRARARALCGFSIGKYTFSIEMLSYSPTGLLKGTGQGSKNLEEVFEARLVKIGHVIALLDTWDTPRYLTRIWTIYEQFTAAKLGVALDMILPSDAQVSLMNHFEEGKSGIVTVVAALANVDSEHAEAFSAEDETKVKALIQDSIGFKAVNRALG